MKFNITPMGMGMVAAQNADIIIAGGFRSGNSSANVTRLRYMIHCPKLWKENLDKGMSNEDAQDASKVGLVDLFVKDGESDTLGVVGLVNIEIDKEHRRKGYARKVIDGIRHTTGEALEIHDIKKHYAATWRKLGVEVFHNGQGTPIKVSKHGGHIAGTMPPIELAAENTKKQEADEGMAP